MIDEAVAGKRTFGLWSVAVGFIALAGIVFHFFAGPLEPPPPLELSIAEKAVSIRDATVAALKGEEYEARSTMSSKTLDDYLTYSFIAVALLAILLAVIAFIRHEPWRASAAGAALGGLAITFQFAIILFFGLLFVILLTAVMDKLDFSF